MNCFRENTRKLYTLLLSSYRTVDFEDPLGYEWTVVIDGVIVPLASHAVAGRVAHINWYYYGPERQYCSRVAHITLLVVWTPFERIFKRKYGYVGEP